MSWALHPLILYLGTHAHQIVCDVVTSVPSVGRVVPLPALLCSSNSLSWYGEESYIQSMEPGAKVVTWAWGPTQGIGVYMCVGVFQAKVRGGIFLGIIPRYCRISIMGDGVKSFPSV